jgi:hypothetical protein
MSILIYLFLLSFITTIQCQTRMVNQGISSKSTCFKDISIYRSNSPYTIQKQGDRVCINDDRGLLLFLVFINWKIFYLETKIDTTNYEQLKMQTIDSKIVPRSINTDSSVSSPLGTPINLTQYLVNYLYEQISLAIRSLFNCIIYLYVKI